MGLRRGCCVAWSTKQGAIAIAVFTFLASIIWLGWQTYQLILLNSFINDGDGACAPNPCLHGGVCLLSERSANKDGYVCDCWGTGFDGIKCNASRIRSAAKRSCSDYWVEGYRTNGKYMIDLDGPDMKRTKYYDRSLYSRPPWDEEVSENNLDPIVVTCEFTDSVAYTVFDAYDNDPNGGDNTENFKDTDLDDGNILLNFSYAEDYEDEVYYNSTQIRKYMDEIVRMSDDCLQTLNVTCVQYPLYGGASDVSDHSMYITLADGSYSDMAGNVFNNLTELYIRFMCNCYLNDTCLDIDENTLDKRRCMCNSEDDDRTDILTLTKMEHGATKLPINYIYFPLALATTDSQMTYTLSGLKCYERFDVVAQRSRYDNGGYGARGRSYFTQEMIDGFSIMWGCMLAFVVVTALLLITAIVLLIAAWGDVSGAMVPWIIMIILFNIMLFVIVIIRWYFLSFTSIVWEVGVAAIWLALTFYGIFAVVAFYTDLTHGVVSD